MNLNQCWAEKIKGYALEDGLDVNLKYLADLPKTNVECTLKIKSDAVVAGVDIFTGVFDFLANHQFQWDLNKLEGRSIKKSDHFSQKFILPFNIAINGERLALNLLSRASAVATYTAKFVNLAQSHGIQILDTRKTTPGLKALEKYAVTVGGGKNHRFGSTEILMVKDNHKKIFGGLENTVNEMKKMGGFYSPLIVEIHDLEELKLAQKLNIHHLMLDNFDSSMINEAIKMKKADWTYEISGGVNLENINQFLIKGIDAISIGGLTHNPPPVDMSLKMSLL
jgi:nicotinate-nucleotide pyrophosphorylase (carboxylating)